MNTITRVIISDSALNQRALSIGWQRLSSQSNARWWPRGQAWRSLRTSFAKVPHETAALCELLVVGGDLIGSEALARWIDRILDCS